MNTLYVSNLPLRPDSFNKFQRLVLNTINPQADHESIQSKFDVKSTKTQDEVPLLDEKYGITGLSRYGCAKLKRSCFLTFRNASDANFFLQDFRDKLSINGRKAHVEVAKEESYLALYSRGSVKELQDKLRSRKSRISADSKKSRDHIMKRRMRRARCKLRKKGLDEEKIQEMVAKLSCKKHKRSASHVYGKSGAEIVSKPSATKKIVAIEGNPPHHILLVQNLPKAISQQELETLFASEGLQEVRLVSMRNLCFVEYDSVTNAAAVLDLLGHEHTYQNTVISIGFAKK